MAPFLGPFGPEGRVQSSGGIGVRLSSVKRAADSSMLAYWFGSKVCGAGRRKYLKPEKEMVLLGLDVAFPRIQHVPPLNNDLLPFLDIRGLLPK